MTFQLIDFGDLSTENATAWTQKHLWKCIVLNVIPVQQWMDALSELQESNVDHFQLLISCIMDVLWVFDHQLSESSDESICERLKEFARDLYDNELVPLHVFWERLETPFLESIEMIASHEMWKRKTIRMNTAMLYRQQKFNLLREESEGYAKLLVEVHARLSADTSDKSLTPIVRMIQSLIGSFDLDPNRVIDLLLDMFVENIQQHADFFIALFKKASWHTADVWATLMGFKFKFHEGKVAFRSFYEAAALLIKHGFMSLEGLYPHLSPTDIEINADFEKLMIKAKQEAKNMNRALLTGDSQKKDEEKEVSKDNQKARLCGVLLSNDLWNDALRLLNRFPKLCALEPRLIPLICHHLHWMIEPVYARLRPEHRVKRLKVEGAEEHFVDDPFNPHTRAKCQPSQQQCESYRDILDGVLPILNLVGPRLHHDIYFATKLMRLIRNAPEELLAEFKAIFMTFVLPALSLSEGNVGLCTEVWTWLKIMPYQDRYAIYGAWRTLLYDKSPEMMVVKAKTVKETKRIMRRISKENFKQYGRHLGKLMHSNPTVCFSTIIDQLQVYENLISPVVECLRYLTELDFDALSFVLLAELGDPKKTRLKPDGTNLSLWLNCLAEFAGHLFRRYPGIELTGLLFYIYYQVLDGNPFDLVVMKELVTKMSGIEQLLEGASESQLQAMAGGETLKTEAITYGQVRNTTKSTERLVQALSDADMACSFAVLIGKQRSSCVFHSGIEHLKLLSSLYDQTQETFLHFSDFIASHVDPSIYESIVPSITKLIMELKLEPELAWSLIRPKIRQEALADVTFEADSGMDMDPHWPPTVIQLIEDVHELYGQDVWHALNPRFYVIFWHLALYDIFVPTERYEAEIQKQKTILAEIEKDRHAAERRKKDVERAQSVVERLRAEQNQQSANYTLKKKLLLLDKDRWFAGSNSRQLTVTYMLQYCIRPRVLFSANDAIFCARLIFDMHEMGAANFSSLSLLDQIITDVNTTVFTCTQNEAMYYGRFLSEVLGRLKRWHSDVAAYQKEAIGNDLPGFRRRWNQQSTDVDIMDYDSYRAVLFKWHFRLNRYFLACFDSKEYMKTRNAILILDGIADFFPAVTSMGIQLERRVRKLYEEEQREDLKVLLNRYLASLIKHMPTWIPRDKFEKYSEEEKKEEKPEGKKAEKADSKNETAPVADLPSKIMPDVPNSSSPVKPSAETVKPPSSIRRKMSAEDLEEGEHHDGAAAETETPQVGSKRLADAEPSPSKRRKVDTPTSTTSRERDRERRADHRSSWDSRDNKDRESRDGKDKESRDGRESRESRDRERGDRDQRDREDRERRDNDQRNRNDGSREHSTRNRREVRLNRDATDKIQNILSGTGRRDEKRNARQGAAEARVTRSENGRNDEQKKDDRRDDPKKEDRRDDPKKEDSTSQRRDDTKRDDNKRDEGRKDEVSNKRDDNRREEQRRDDTSTRRDDNSNRGDETSSRRDNNASRRDENTSRRDETSNRREDNSNRREDNANRREDNENRRDETSNRRDNRRDDQPARRDRESNSSSRWNDGPRRDDRRTDTREQRDRRRRR